MTDAAPRLGSEARKRCISSLQVTYHQEIRKPVPRLGESPFSGYPENRWSSVVHEQETPGHINTISSYSCVPVHQSLEGACLQERRLEPSPEEQDFYPPPPPPLSVPSNSEQLPLDTLSQQHAVHHSCGPTPPPLSCYQPTPRSPLFGLEDGLRHRVNVEIENFRASIQEIVREQFASQRHQLHTAPPTCCSDQHNCTVKEERNAADTWIQTLDVVAEPLANSSQDDHVHSVETSVDSGVCIETTPTESEATPPSTEEEMNLALIRLQTLAALISCNLQRAEYSSTPP